MTMCVGERGRQKVGIHTRKLLQLLLGYVRGWVGGCVCENVCGREW